MARINYTEFEGGFNQVVLEESFVMNLKTTMSFVDFKINLAVNPNYPLYVAPEPPSVPSSGEEDSEYCDYWEDDDEDEHGEHGSSHAASTSVSDGPTATENVIDDSASVAVARPPGDASAGSHQENADTAGPEPATIYPYRMGRIFFPNMEQVRWVSRIQPYIDPSSGSVDYGAIDYFYRNEEDGRYYLAGYWGELELLSGPPILEIDELKQHMMQQQQQQKNKPNPS
jgi:hypothetical protein